MISRKIPIEKHTYTVAAGVLAQVLQYLTFKKVDINHFLLAVDVDIQILKNPDERISVDKYILVEEKAAQIIEDPCIGLHMGQYIEAGNWSILGYMMMNCNNVMEAFQKLSRYSCIIGNLIKGEIRTEEDKIIVELTEPMDAPKISEHCYEGFFSSLISLARNLTGENICPLEVSLETLKVEYIDEYKKVFGEKVIFRKGKNYLILDKKEAEMPAHLPNQNLLDCFENYAKEIISEIETPDSYLYRTKKLILSYMDTENLSIKTIANEFNISDRTLQANLKKEGTEFSKLLKETREQLAKKYLLENYSIEDITFLLGFSEASVFRKAFKKWVGITPKEYRKNR